jgi:hypothetical protein
VSFQLDLDYIDVAARIVEFRTKHPEGSFQQVSLDFKEVAGKWYVIYTAAAYRAPDDERPGIGTAWEPVPGKTNFTRDSELQNAETAAWGRAIVASLAADTKRGVASAQEVRNRRADQDAPVAPPQEPDEVDPVKLARIAVKAAWEVNGGAFVAAAVEKNFTEWSNGEVLMDAPADRLYQYADHLKSEAGA